MNLRVVDSLPAKAFPNAVEGPRRLRSVSHLYDRTTVLGHVSTSPDEAYAITDKTSPHALYELMIVSAGNTIRSGLHDHSPQFGQAFGVMAHSFANHCHAYDLAPIVSWSYDPHTLDRASIQGEKRFHSHFVGRTQADRTTVAATAVRAAQLPTTRARCIVEEASVLGSLLAADCVDRDALRLLVPVPALSTPLSTLTAQFLLPNGWESLTDPGLHADLSYIYRALRRTYDEILRVCTTGTSGPWKRPAVREFDVDHIEIPLRPETRATLAHYLRALRPDLLSDSSSRARNAHVYPLADLAYAVIIAEQDGEVYLHIRANVFSDLGGAGTSFLDGVIVRTQKGVGTLRRDEIAARKAFQTEYLGQLHRNPLSPRVFFPSS
ncbi:hypothetical protein ABZ926_15015 [Streptomyces litmocidini]|uniref:hypothetical protein n=1 Tax=Streptomyces litmocidini TaxID=67318 RepID=UPI00341028CB